MVGTRRARDIFNRLNLLAAGIAGALIVADAVAVSVDVIGRYFINKTWAGLTELTEYSMVWITFLGAAWLLQKNAHVRLDFITNLLDRKRKAFVNTIAYSLGAVPLGIMLWYTAVLTIHDYRTNFRFASMLELPKWPFEIIIPIGSLLLVIQALIKISEYLAEWKAAQKGTGV